DSIMDNWTILQNELAKYKETLVYNVDGTITRLKDVIEEPADYYWVMERIDESVTLLSCVGSPEFLYDTVSREDYEKLETLWEEGRAVIRGFREWLINADTRS